MSGPELLPKALRMLVDLTVAAVKLLVAFYSASLLLAADGLYGLYAWYSELNRPKQEGRAQSIAAAAAGLILAAAAVGLGWEALGNLAARFQGLRTTAPGYFALITAAAMPAVSDLLHRGLRRTGSGAEGIEIRHELRFEQLVSRISLAVLAPAVLFGGRLGMLDSLAGMLLSILLSVEILRIVYLRVEPFFTSGES